MSHTCVDVDPADGAARVAVPDGWVCVDPARAQGDGTTQAITVTDWLPSWGVRPSMTVTTTPPASDHIAARVLAEAQASLRDVLVVSIDPWAVPGSIVPGRRLVFAHTDGDATLCTLVWVLTTGAGDVVVSARVEAMRLHLYDGAFAEAVAGIELPGEPQAAGAPGAADLARRAQGAPWADVAPVGEGVRATMVADPDARILVEASVGSASHRFDATLARDLATISATASPRASVWRPADPAATNGASTTFRLPVTRLALVLAQWLGLGPARTAAAAPVTLPMSAVMNRLVDPSVPVPEGVDATTWQQPWFLWTLRSSATDSGLVMVDTGTSGQCAVMETDDERTTRFAPLSSYQVWRTLNWLISESLVG